VVGAAVGINVRFVVGAGVGILVWFVGESVGNVAFVGAVVVLLLLLVAQQDVVWQSQASKLKS